MSRLFTSTCVGAFLVTPALPAFATAQDAASAESVVAIVPQPESLTVGRGHFVLSATTVIYADAATADIARRFAASLAPATGLTVPVRVGAVPGTTGIVLTRSARPDSRNSM